MTGMDTELARSLREVIAALDRRVPRIERVGEASIARDAAVLRKRARTRLATLETQMMCAPPDPVS